MAKFIFPWLAAPLSVACVLVGCQSRQPASPVGTAAAQSTRDNGYSLLHQLLEEQKDVSLLRFIKGEHSDVKDLMKRIAAASGAGAALLEEFAKHDPSINLKDLQLPPVETATR